MLWNSICSTVTIFDISWVVNPTIWATFAAEGFKTIFQTVMTFLFQTPGHLFPYLFFSRFLQVYNVSATWQPFLTKSVGSVSSKLKVIFVPNYLYTFPLHKGAVSCYISEEPHWVEVLTEVLLSLLTRPSSLFRHVVDHVFTILAPHLTRNALNMILEVGTWFGDQNTAPIAWL